MPEPMWHMIVFDCAFRTSYVIPVERAHDWNEYCHLAMKTMFDPKTGYKYPPLPDYAVRLSENAHVQFTEWKQV